jgi:NAD(P)-dependent dehydrogenase (short-subunit alcohol dehydrogenase family)
MALKVEMVTFDCGDPAKLASWWAEQFYGTTQELLPGEFVAVTRPEGPRLGFQKVPDPTHYEKVQLLKQHDRTQDVAASVAFLASDEVAFVTAAVLDVDGGAVVKL